MNELILLGVIIALLGLIIWKEIQYNKHVRFLEEKIIKTNPELYWTERNEGKRVVPNSISQENQDEVPLTEIPMMEFGDRDFKIEMEGDSETPAEAVARKER
jgi:hypothetical protein